MSGQNQKNNEPLKPVFSLLLVFPSCNSKIFLFCRHPLCTAQGSVIYGPWAKSSLSSSLVQSAKKGFYIFKWLRKKRIFCDTLTIGKIQISVSVNKELNLGCSLREKKIVPEAPQQTSPHGLRQKPITVLDPLVLEN